MKKKSQLAKELFFVPHCSIRYTVLESTFLTCFGHVSDASIECIHRHRLVSRNVTAIRQERANHITNVNTCERGQMQVDLN